MVGVDEVKATVIYPYDYVEVFSFNRKCLKHLSIFIVVLFVKTAASLRLCGQSRFRLVLPPCNVPGICN